MPDVQIPLSLDPKKTRIDKFLQWPAGDFGDKIQVTVLDKDGNAEDITGITPRWIMFRTFGMQEIFNRDMTVVTGTAGRSDYTVVQSDFEVRAIFFARCVLINGTTSQRATEYCIFRVI